MTEWGPYVLFSLTTFDASSQQWAMMSILVITADASEEVPKIKIRVSFNNDAFKVGLTHPT